MFSLLHICPLRENQWRIFKSLALNLRVVRKSKRSLRVLCSIISPRVKTEKIYIFLVLYVCVVRKSKKNHCIFYIYLCVIMRAKQREICVSLFYKTGLVRKETRNLLHSLCVAQKLNRNLCIRCFVNLVKRVRRNAKEICLSLILQDTFVD